MALTAGTAAAQDAKAVLQAASAAMGGTNLKTIQISGTGGFVAGVGHSYTSRDDWPRAQVTSYTRTIDYDAKSSREEVTTRSAGDYRDYPGRYDIVVGPPRDGLTPREGRQISIVSGNYAWTVDGKNNPRAPFGIFPPRFPRRSWQLDILLPRTVFKAAMGATRGN